MAKVVVYTVNIGAYEPLLAPHVFHPSMDYVCLTDTPVPEVPPWQQRVVLREMDDPSRESRRFKIMPHRHFPEAEYTLYHDGNIRLKHVHFLDWLTDRDMAFCTHPLRDCVYQEAEACIEAGKGSREEIEDQMARYKAEGYPEHAGLAAGTVILRRHTEAVRRFNETWWEEYSKGSSRDQLSLHYTSLKLGIGYDLIPNGLYGSDKFEWVFPSWHMAPAEEIWL